jgi:hypothetical protein
MNEAPLGDALDVRRARLVVIHDEWVGFNAHSPVAAIYELRRGTRGGLFGEGRLSTAIAGKRVVDVNVPSAAATQFLTAVASARVVPGPYLALLNHTDDYPHIEIVLDVDVRENGDSGGLALLFTESQGEFHAPWGACLGGKMFSLPGEEIGKALAALRRPPKRATLDRMMTETASLARDTRQRSAAPPPS